MNPALRTVCVDWNGVLDTYTGYRGPNHFDPPRAGAAEFLAQLKNMGLRVVVLSTRGPQDVRKWLEQHGLAQFVDDVTDRKVPAVAYIDDRALPFRGNYDEVVAALAEFKPHWRR